MGVQYLEEVFHEALMELQAREVGLIPDVFEVGENMILRILLSRGSTNEVFNRGLDTSVIEAKNRWRNRDRGRRGREGLSMIVTYTQVGNTLGIHLIYSQIM